MSSAKVFKSGNSQAVRLPKEYQLDVDEVIIKKVGNMLILIPESGVWDNFEKGLSMFDDSFMDNRNQPAVQEREGF
ncbi:type II toxin-antitoxin system antitoxin VapB [Seleniivibrio woodruffii]|uniref:Antitoxin VapB n=1 Tax=Seleniivibrio woodruffii TaxID=1078050 RepID=A0A4R1KEA1_9BACT|nr:type II toxin-antitoxin system VapB family antitoxin [Seleniivibrio woodruffii]TCK62447.1 antitoxin VapB [Seleniivibrio woodruffii]TVZ34435.1 antitoxin VapB [Seleniivibrio woodruffii]